MLSPNSIEALVAAAIEAHDNRDRRSDHLKRQVYTAVDELKAAGFHPEQVIVVIRSFITHATPRLFPVAEDLAAWCLERYYSAPPSDGEA